MSSRQLGGASVESDVTVDTLTASVSMIIVILSVLALENIFHLLHFITTDTAFSKMIVRIEKELMIVGSTAFIFRLIVAPTAESSPTWAAALNYADLIIPIFSFCYCGIGLLLIVSSLKQCDIWSKAYHLHLIELLDEFVLKTGQLTFKFSWKPMHRIINKVEFRIFHFIFCDFFQIQPSAFAFDEYVARVYEKYVFSIISIGIMHWLLLCLIVLLNWARIALGLQYHSCHEGDSKCQKVNDIIIFTILGAILYFITLVLVYVSRNLEMKIMLKRDITSYKSYYQYLHALDEVQEMGSPQILERLNEEGLKEIVQKATLKAHRDKMDDDILGE